VSEIEPFDTTDRALMWQLAGRWLRDRPGGGSGSRLIDSVLERFTAVDEAALLQHAPRLPVPLDIGPKLGWIIGRSVPKAPASVPVTTIQLDGTTDGINGCCIRTGVFHEREDGTVAVDGWRFDSAETTEEAIHPYQHAQAIIGWTISGTCLFHPSGSCDHTCPGIDLSSEETVDAERIAARDRINQSHPAFPFATRSLTGLVAVAMTAFYGASTVRTLIYDDPRLARAGGAVGADLRTLLG
jgi:hypothetical protein